MKKNILLVERSFLVAKIFREWFPEVNWVWVPLRSYAENCLNLRRYDAAVVGLDLTDSQGLGTYYYLQNLVPTMPVLVLTEPGAVEAGKEGLPKEAAARINRSDMDRDSFRRAVQGLLDGMGQVNNKEILAA